MMSGLPERHADLFYTAHGVPMMKLPIGKKDTRFWGLSDDSIILPIVPIYLSISDSDSISDSISLSLTLTRSLTLSLPICLSFFLSMSLYLSDSVSDSISLHLCLSISETERVRGETGRQTD